MRSEHLENAKSLNAAGVVPFAGAMLHAHGTSGATDAAAPRFKGSVLVVRAESEAACREVLMRDVYVSAQVWNMAQVQIVPFKTVLTPHL